jgi:ferredoxin
VLTKLQEKTFHHLFHKTDSNTLLLPNTRCYEHTGLVMLEMANESILRRFRLGGIDPSVRCRSGGDCEGDCEGSETEDEGTTDSGGSKGCSVFTGHS